MSFWKKFAASVLESGVQSMEKQRDYANKILETKGERLTDEQRQRIELYAYSDNPERAREMARELRNEE